MANIQINPDVVYRNSFSYPGALKYSSDIVSLYKDITISAYTAEAHGYLTVNFDITHYSSDYFGVLGSRIMISSVAKSNGLQLTFLYHSRTNNIITLYYNYYAPANITQSGGLSATVYLYLWTPPRMSKQT